MSLSGDRGGSVELDSVWVHLGPDARPARIVDFGVYEGSTDGRAVSTKLELAEPTRAVRRTHWPLRSTDADLLGHVNNAVYWQAVEDCLRRSDLDPRRPLRARLDYRHAIDLGDEVELIESADDRSLTVAFRTGEVVKAIATVEHAG